ncbi:FG-GAP repeat domain-containing protein [Sphingomonas flavescens]|uniref:FG-GAP repeat domain-containing protein n=1 Tax=Sphingomonas flavescens TaxID=3132797 RepID=UPI002805956E|nr:FG-GAP-like repeat-containing protein [Sphingomonas limnosediminicola]
MRSLTDRIGETITAHAGSGNFASNSVPQTVALRNGGFAIGWLTPTGTSESPTQLIVEIYDAAGALKNSNIVINQVGEFRLADLAFGGLAVAWTDAGNLKLQSFTDQGIAIAASSIAATNVGSLLTTFSVAGDNFGNAVLHWAGQQSSESKGFGTFSPSGKPLWVSPPPAGQWSADAAVNDNRPVLAWVGDTGQQDSNGLPIYDVGTTSYNADGSVFRSFSMTLPTTILETTRGTIVGRPDRVQAAPLRNGEVLLTWVLSPGDPGNHVQAQIFSSDGTPQGKLIDIVAPANTVFENTSVTKLPSGGFALAWDRHDGDINSDVYAQFFDRLGGATSAAFQVASQPSWESMPSILSTPRGRLIAAWADEGSTRFQIFAGESPPTRANDHNGDGVSDVILRHDDGAISLLVFDKIAFKAIWDTPLSNEWKMAGAGDFDGNGRADILWRSVTGTLAQWSGAANGAFTPAWGTSVDLSWKVAGTGDFNGDGKDDILWRSTSGALADWIASANGGFSSGWGTIVDLSWSVAGTGDFNGDGKDDILWRCTDGSLATWLASKDGGFIPTWGTVLSSEWDVVGTGDFNRDGKSDVLWRSTDGSVSYWIGTGDGGFIPACGTNTLSHFDAVGIGDYDGDGFDDVLWQGESGQLLVTFGTDGGDGYFAGWPDVGSVPTGWQVQQELFA